MLRFVLLLLGLFAPSLSSSAAPPPADIGGGLDPWGSPPADAGGGLDPWG